MMIMVKSRCPLLRRGEEIIGGEPIFMGLRSMREALMERERQRQRDAAFSRLCFAFDPAPKTSFDGLMEAPGRQSAKSRNGRFL